MRVTHSKDRRQFTQHVSIRATAADGTTGVMPQNGSNWSAVTAVRALDSRVKDFERAACRLRRVARRRRPRPNLRVTSKARAPRTKAVAPRNASNQTGASTPAAASRPDTRPRRRARCMHRLLSLWRTWQRVWRRLRHSVWRRLRIHRACDPSASCDATDIGCFGRFDATDTSSGPCFAFVNRFPKKHRSLFADRLAPPRCRSRLGWFARWVHGCPHPPFPASQCVPPPLSESLPLSPSLRCGGWRRHCIGARRRWAGPRRRNRGWRHHRASTSVSFSPVAADGTLASSPVRTLIIAANVELYF